jgi:hypothetical protein
MTDSLVPQSEPKKEHSRVRIWCSPSHLAEDTRAKRVVDRFLPTTVWRWVFFGAVAIAISAATSLPSRPGLALGATATFLAGTYCLLNFWRCREAHCIVSGIGWSGLAVFEIVEITFGRSLIHREESLVFLLVLVVAVAFETVWRRRHGTNVVISKA